MTYDTINDGEATPLQILDGTSVAPRSTKHKRTSSIIVRALMVGTIVAVGALLLMAGPSKMTTMNKTSNVDGMVVVSSARFGDVDECRPKTGTSHDDIDPCVPQTGTFSGLSCKHGMDWCHWCSDGKWRTMGWWSVPIPDMDDFETCYVSQNGYCWSHSHAISVCRESVFGGCKTYYKRCDPVGYFDGDDGYNKDGFWHVATPLPDGSCGNPCQEFEKTL